MPTHLSQEFQCSKKSVVDASRKISRKEKKVKNFNFKKGERVKVRRDNSCSTLTLHHQKVGMEEHENSRNFYGAIISGNVKVNASELKGSLHEKKKRIALFR